jgi:hypothetical protein
VHWWVVLGCRIEGVTSSHEWIGCGSVAPVQLLAFSPFSCLGLTAGLGHPWAWSLRALRDLPIQPSYLMVLRDCWPRTPLRVEHKLPQGFADSAKLFVGSACLPA